MIHNSHNNNQDKRPGPRTPILEYRRHPIKQAKSVLLHGLQCILHHHPLPVVLTPTTA
ncbi:hypothetical protein E4U17_000069 [Claviceps sp. LM77 group G4]|nr:hypothetical protein E4U17_000069 [Claviceps sp. LM77 group G4]